MGDLWKLKLPWDVIPSELNRPKELSFPRCMIDDCPGRIVYFLQCLEKGIWVCRLCCTGSQIELSFYKGQNDSFKSRSLLTLELLAVFLAIKCIDCILKPFSNACVESVHIAVEAQVVLS